MKKKSISIKPALLLWVLLAPVMTGFAQTIQVPANFQKNIVANRLPNETPIPANVRNKIMIKRIDLSAAAINFSVVSCKDKFNGVVKIEGVVKNTGTLNYTSGPNQQVALLYEDKGGRPTLVATRVFQNLTPGQQVQVSFTRPWYKGEEFPPKYILIISYDPDIYIDSNDNNDDSNSGNNRLEKSGSEISALTFNCK